MPAAARPPIEDYAFIGNRRTGAVISREGSIDWLCLPDFDDPACFTAILGGPEHGRWLLTASDCTGVERTYVNDAMVLQTTYTTPTGRARSPTSCRRSRAGPTCCDASRASRAP